ncbi:BAQ_1a_G0041680.mRNA.1.CDS.1 [Saccharomyces cerevisiae]|nr:BAQ_1a_G0041680.mRNA.1.CDS.1 [Saccharomyces cerevisiae]CAI4705350.1 BAM_G0041670.mRNA.1.CDS.1 [Saccharomyces cerevisiae]CAI7272658.1 BAM_G0041670.mRNA.1.CDS.1 [Saccharomyces cerevisiae]CAI7274363.1 BAQ_1a_G0041680.mRNA.1.CDS.1 [Saccharomyces cerevisiae]
MGNVPGKIDQEDSFNDVRPDSSYNTTSSNSVIKQYDEEASSRVRTRRTTSLVNNILNGNNARTKTGSHLSSTSRRKTSREKELAKEAHAKQLVVRCSETVDGGFLAPFGCYSFEKLDYDATVVKNLIIKRKLAPFYTPLQDFDESWTRDELIKIVDGLPLHDTFDENLEEFEDVPIGNLRKSTFNELIDKSLSKKEQRRMHAKIFRARLYKKRILWQENENETFLERKLEMKRIGSKFSNVEDNTSSQPRKNYHLPSDDLKYTLYKNGSECPICFLYFPGPFNYSKCCQQPICTECFVQIKRADPHFPHDEVDPTEPQTNDSEKDPNLLTSEPANCPYCATASFSITYQPPTNRETGIGGMPADSYVYKDAAISRADGGQPNISAITSDTIRPDWEIKLNKERARLMRRSANATAIHISNRLIDPSHSTRRNTSHSITPIHDESTSASRSPEPTINELEDQMVREAIRLSLEDQDNRKKSKNRNTSLRP